MPESHLPRDLLPGEGSRAGGWEVRSSGATLARRLLGRYVAFHWGDTQDAERCAASRATTCQGVSAVQRPGFFFGCHRQQVQTSPGPLEGHPFAGYVPSGATMRA